MEKVPTKEEMKIKKDKEAIASMKAARDNMATALSRIQSLESVIHSFSSLVDEMMKFIPDNTYRYDGRETMLHIFKKRQEDNNKLV